MRNAKRLQHYVNISWLISAAVALFASLLLFGALGTYSFVRDLRTAQDELATKAQVVARRLSGELLIEPRGAPDAVAKQLITELDLADVTYHSMGEILSSSDALLFSDVPVPFLENKYFARVSAMRPSLASYFDFVILITCVLAIGLIVGIGLYLQTKYLKKHVIGPIESLVDASTRDDILTHGWPQELQEISGKLNESFRQRERIVFAQIARGVVHDIKTMLQSIKVALDLAKEAPTELRLKNLWKVTDAKFSSVLGLIDTTLDSNRDISLRPNFTCLHETVKRSIDTLQALPIAKEAIIEVRFAQAEIEIFHDSVQIERAITNILKNGLEAINEDPTAERRVRISYSLSNKNFVGLRIEDAGPGLPENPNHVFRFLKSTKPHGSGLGLLLSKKIIEAHGGSLIAEHSLELGGAKFEISLPKGGTIDQ